VRQAFRAYVRWRDGRPERHLSLVLFAALAIAALVASTAATMAGAARRRQAARGATVAPLAARLDPFADSITGTTYVQDTIHAGPIAGRYAAQLLARPHDQVSQVLRANWNRLMGTGADYADAERLLDLDHVGPTPAERDNETAEASRHLPPCR